MSNKELALAKKYAPLVDKARLEAYEEANAAYWRTRGMDTSSGRLVCMKCGIVEAHHLVGRYGGTDCPRSR
jgi:hypothetical protein